MSQRIFGVLKANIIHTITANPKVENIATQTGYELIIFVPNSTP